ncbi:unnamed protein product (macronuclear) [Paramecium tetraurelia]|uniref:Transmembrane protein n=1 Tax=Paramecium tetraurelia TaxID=5888 RepID=A0DY36_PARTE|nr:uncharacterized protein GSPATT00039835001 [Paramecium tetraurelia]CAK87953.1 unnamed protein product [Paramecium tetraurelia]|eukprot:XP_001455350.1 hypothetical protein (macronuclear) [Paramecium tetraurelia strain d4-2]
MEIIKWKEYFLYFFNRCQNEYMLFMIIIIVKFIYQQQKLSLQQNHVAFFKLKQSKVLNHHLYKLNFKYHHLEFILLKF